MYYKVLINKAVQRKLPKLPLHIRIKLKSWIDLVENYGVLKTRLIPGFHDEPLKGSRIGQRSIRLSRSYRAFYVEKNQGNCRY